jgi:hypothetical protein
MTYYSLLRLCVNEICWWSAVSAGLILLTKVYSTLVLNLCIFQFVVYANLTLHIIKFCIVYLSLV